MEKGIKENLNNTAIKTAVAAAAVGSLVAPAVEADQTPKMDQMAQVDQLPEMAYQASIDQASIDRRVDYQAPHHARSRVIYTYTGYAVRGRTSTFGWPLEANGTTADGGTTARACFAIRNSSTLGHRFLVKVGRHHAVMRQCDWGPASWTGRDIDLTATAVKRLKMNPYRYPTGVVGVVKEIRKRRRVPIAKAAA